MICSYKDLDIWKLAVEQCVEIYRVTKKFPKDELYGIVSQMRRASTSIAANIAEGYARRHNKEKAHFISISLGSNAEVEAHVIIAEKLGYLSRLEVTELSEVNDHVGRALTKFFRTLDK